MSLINNLPRNYLSKRGAVVNVTVPSDITNGTRISCTCGSSTLFAAVDSSKQASFRVFMGTWNFSCGVLSRTLVVDETKTYSIELSRIYAYRVNTTDPDPSSRVSYPETVSIDGVDYAVTNYGYNPLRNIAGSGVTYGSWTGNEFFFPKPCMLTYAGEVDYYLDPNDYTKKLDGSASDVADLNYGGNAMVQFPRTWVRRQIVNIDGTNYEEFVLSGTKLSNDFHAYAHKDSVDGTLRDYMYQGAYSCCSDGLNRLRSISGQTITTGLRGAANNANLYATGVNDSMIGRAINNNVAGNITPGRWFSRTWAQWCYLQDLTFLLTCNTNGQSSIGNGNCGGTEIKTTGQTNTFGLFGGNVTTNNTNVKCLGIEDMWGNHFKWAVGCSLNDNQQRIFKMCVDGEDGSVPGVYNFAGTGGVPKGHSASGTGFPNSFIFDQFGRISGNISGGSNSTYFCDQEQHLGSTSSTSRLGGHYNDTSNAGPARFSLYGFMSGTAKENILALAFV